jgi:hypothetical protein
MARAGFSEANRVPASWNRDAHELGKACKEKLRNFQDLPGRQQGVSSRFTPGCEVPSVS